VGSLLSRDQLAGRRESRKHYRDVLVSYLSGFKDKLSKESLERLERNPMRILDSKDEGDRQIVANAPVYSDHLNQASRISSPRARRARADRHPHASIRAGPRPRLLLPHLLRVHLRRSRRARHGHGRRPL
jgi:hypothetical protein